MNHNPVLKLVVLLLSLALPYSASAHPYEGEPQNTPLAFVPHETDDGRPVYSNIPKRCFSAGRLTCSQLHPLFKGTGTIKKD